MGQKGTAMFRFVLALTLVGAALFLLPACGGECADGKGPCAPADDDTAVDGGLAPVSFRFAEAAIPGLDPEVATERLQAAQYCLGGALADPDSGVEFCDGGVLAEPGEPVEVGPSTSGGVRIALPGYGHAECQVHLVADGQSPSGSALKVSLQGAPDYPQVWRDSTHAVNGGAVEWTMHDGDSLAVVLNRLLDGVWDCATPGSQDQPTVGHSYGGELTQSWWGNHAFVYGHDLVVYTQAFGFVEAEIAPDGASWVATSSSLAGVMGCELH
jgi:hypothetical protein